MKLAIIKYNAGNIRSVLYALERIGVEATVTDDHDEIGSADKVIFPGVGEARSAMNYLEQHNLDQLIRNLKQPVLGICLGMQLMCDYSEENDTPCLGIFNSKVRRFDASGTEYKVPQIGWNEVYNLGSPIYNKVAEKSYCYFVHGYYADLSDYTISSTDYIKPYSSGLHRDNFYGVQFHPEKSATVGEQILGNFLSL